MDLNDRITVPMCRHVSELLPPTRQAHLRSAGTVGYDAFEELVVLGDVPAYVEVTEGGDARLGALMNAPIRGVKKPFRPRKKIPHEYVIVFWEKAMRRRSIIQPNWSHLPWVSIRYHYDVHADRTHPIQHPMYPFDCSVMNGSRATNIEMSGFDTALETPTNFLCNCPNLKVANLSNLSSVQVINTLFMQKANVQVDLSSLHNVHIIRTSMMQQYFHDSIDLSPLRNVVTIGDCFMSLNTLTSIDLSPFVKLESVGTGFLSTSVELESIDLRPLVSIKSVGPNFLMACSKLTTIDLRPLKGVTKLGPWCLHSCVALTSVMLPTFDHPGAVGSYFLRSCSALQHIELSPLHNLTTIPENFLLECKGLTNLDLAPFSGVTSIKSGFLSGCSGLTAIDLSPLRNVQAPLTHFMDGCSNIVHLNMSPMVSITRADKIGATWMYKGRVTYDNNSCVMM